METFQLLIFSNCIFKLHVSNRSVVVAKCCWQRPEVGNFQVGKFEMQIEKKRSWKTVSEIGKVMHQGIVAQLGMIWCGWRSRARPHQFQNDGGVDGANESKRMISIFSSAMMKKVKWYQFFKRWLGLKCGNIEPKLDQKIEILKILKNVNHVTSISERF